MPSKNAINKVHKVESGKVNKHRNAHNGEVFQHGEKYQSFHSIQSSPIKSSPIQPSEEVIKVPTLTNYYINPSPMTNAEMDEEFFGPDSVYYTPPPLPSSPSSLYSSPSSSPSPGIEGLTLGNNTIKLLLAPVKKLHNRKSRNNRRKNRRANSRKNRRH